MTKSSRILAILMLGPAVGGCGHVQQPLHVYLVVDRTTRVRKVSASRGQADTDYFSLYRAAMAQKVVLSKLRSGDSVTVIPLDDRSDDSDVQTFVLNEDESPGRRELPSLLRLRDYVSGLMPSRRPGSDFAGALSFIQRESTRKRDSSQEAGPEVAVFLSDGEADGWQDSVSGFPGVPVWVFGTIRAEPPPRFRQVAEQAGVAKLHWIPLNQWETAGSAWGADYGRKPDAGLLNCLQQFPPRADPTGEQVTYVYETGKLPAQPIPSVGDPARTNTTGN